MLNQGDGYNGDMVAGKASGGDANHGCKNEFER